MFLSKLIYSLGFHRNCQTVSEILAPLLTFPGYRAHKLTGSLAGIGNARLWLDMQTAYELAQARSKETPRVEPLVAL